jgi:hypothetical protein
MVDDTACRIATPAAARRLTRDVPASIDQYMHSVSAPMSHLHERRDQCNQRMPNAQPAMVGITIRNSARTSAEHANYNGSLHTRMTDWIDQRRVEGRHETRLTPTDINTRPVTRRRRWWDYECRIYGISTIARTVLKFSY